MLDWFPGMILKKKLSFPVTGSDQKTLFSRKKCQNFEHLHTYFLLNGLTPFHLDCWLASNVGIGSHRPSERVLDTWYDSHGVGRGSEGAFWWPICPKISFSDHLVLLNGPQPLDLDCWPASNLRIGSHWPHQWFLDTRYDLEGATRGFTGAILVTDLTKNLIFRPFGPPDWSSTPSFGLLTNF